MTDAGERLEDLTVLDLEERAERLGKLWAERPVVVVFLRHYG
ncbi:MAG: hypothetical protein ACQEXJ_11765 [Myxococcota bacterium]